MAGSVTRHDLHCMHYLSKITVTITVLPAEMASYMSPYVVLYVCVCIFVW